MTTTLLIVAFGAGFLVIFTLNLAVADVAQVRRERARKRLQEEMSLRQKDRARRSMNYKNLYEAASEGLADVKIKKSLRERFVGMVEESGLLELKIFVLAVMVHRTTGGNLSDLLEKIAKVIRERERIHGAIKALTAEGRLQGIILMCLPPGMVVVLLILNRPIFEHRRVP